MFTVMEGLVETALDTPRFGIVVSLSLLIPARAPLIHQRFRALSKDFGKEISSYGLLARVYVFRIRFIRTENGWTRSKKLDTFICPNYTRRGLTLSSAIKQMRFRGFLIVCFYQLLGKFIATYWIMKLLIN